MTNYFMAHGVPDPAPRSHQAIVALGKIVKRQALVWAFSDTFAVIGVVLVLAAIALLMLRKVKRRARRRRALRRAPIDNWWLTTSRRFAGRLSFQIGSM